MASALESPLTFIFAREAAVPAVARLAPVAVAFVVADKELGFARVVIRDGRAFAFSLSLAVVVRVVRVTRRVYERRRVVNY